jgi:phosphatidylglycerophosphatase A
MALIAHGFGLGRLPWAPGSWASVPVAGVFALMCLLGAGALATSVAMAALAIAGSVACILCSPAAIEISGEKDPKQVVTDEIAGQAITFLGVYANGLKAIFVIGAAGFLLFRFFDTVKLFPAGRLEKLAAGWGILGDDLAAGVQAAIILQVCVRFWIGG